MSYNDYCRLVLYKKLTSTSRNYSNFRITTLFIQLFFGEGIVTEVIILICNIIAVVCFCVVSKLEIYTN